jgi:hypothetical protein
VLIAARASCLQIDKLKAAFTDMTPPLKIYGEFVVSLW